MNGRNHAELHIHPDLFGRINPTELRKDSENALFDAWKAFDGSKPLPAVIIPQEKEPEAPGSILTFLPDGIPLETARHLPERIAEYLFGEPIPSADILLRLHHAEQETLHSFIVLFMTEALYTASDFRTDQRGMEPGVQTERNREIGIELSSRYFAELLEFDSDEENALFDMMRDGLFYELGITPPVPVFEPGDRYQDRDFAFRIGYRRTLPQRGLAPDERMVNAPPEDLHLFNLKGRPVTSPPDRTRRSIISMEDAARAADAGLYVWTPLGSLVIGLSAAIRTHASRFWDVSALESYLTAFHSSFPHLTEAIREHFPPDLLRATFHRLIAEGISIRDGQTILQALLDFDYLDIRDPEWTIVFDHRLSGPPLAVRPEGDPTMLSAFIRMRLSRAIAQQYSRGQSTLPVITVAPETEQMLFRMESSSVSPAPSPNTVRSLLLEALRARLARHADHAPPPPLLTSVEVRPFLRDIIALEFPDVPVIAYQELPSDLSVQAVDRLAVDIPEE